MTNETTRKNLQRMRLSDARELIDWFAEEFGQNHLYFAQHAAFPLSLTPDLLYRLWINFQRNRSGEKLDIPWIAVADLLLSPLCKEVGHELYEMDIIVRTELLSALRNDNNLGIPRIQELSNFLLDYVRRHLTSQDSRTYKFAQAQHWTALAYLRPDQAVHELTQALHNLSKNKVEQIRIASLIETLAEPLANLESFTPLLNYARNTHYNEIEHPIHYNRTQNMGTRNAHSIKIFCSYAHKDEELKNELRKHFVRMNISFWQDRDIGLGTDWADEIDKNLEKADIVLLLISVDFLASKYCFEKEMTRALERHREEGIPVIPILIRPVDWRNAPFSNLQASPTSLLPVTRWIDRDEAFVEIASHVRREINKVLKKQYVQDARESTALAQYDMAYLEYRQALGYAPEDAALHVEMGDLLVKLGRLEEALQRYEEAIKLRPENDRFYIQKGHALSQLKQYEEALEAYQQAVMLMKQNDFALYKAMGDTFSILRRLNEALTAYKEAIHLRPNDHQLHIQYGNILFELNNYPEALKAYEAAERITINDPKIYKNKGKAFLSLMNYNGALAAYERVIALQSDDPDSYADKGFVFEELGDYEQALEAYEKAILLNPYNAYYWSEKGNTLVNIKRYEEAYEAYEEAIRLDPGNASFYKDCADTLFKLQRYEEAREAYNDAILRNPNISSWYIARAEANKRIAEKALARYQEAMNHIQYQEANDEKALARYQQAMNHVKRDMLLAEEKKRSTDIHKK